MKRILSLMLVLTLIFILSACSATQSGASMEQIEADILNLEIIEDYFYSEYTYYDFNEIQIDNLSIIKRQTNFDEKEDLVFCDVSMLNKYFNVTFTIKMKYIYYDEGGWILEENEITNKVKTPIAAPEELSVTIASLGDLDEEKSKIIPDSMHLSAYSTEKQNLNGYLKGYTVKVLGYSYDDAQQIVTLKIQAKNKFNLIEGSILLYYFSEIGDWKWYDLKENQECSSARVKIDSITSDFSSLKGKFVQSPFTSPYSLKSIDIKEIYPEMGEADIGLGTNYEFNIIMLGLWSPNGTVGYLYNENTDEWKYDGYIKAIYRREK